MQNNNQVETQWRAMHSDPEQRHALRQEVQDSWHRSDEMGIDAEIAQIPRVSGERLDMIRQENKELLVYSNSILDSQLQRAQDEETIVLLFDNQGHLLKIFGDKSCKEKLSMHSVRVGSKWSENTIGTNVFSLGIKNKGCTKLVGAENYCKHLIDGAYYFAPIELENGDLYGGLAVLTPQHRQSDYLGSLAVSLARAIVLQIFWFVLSDVYGDCSDGQGMLNLDQSDGKNNILVMSSEIFKMLGIPPTTYYYEELETLIDPPPSNKEFWDIINSAQKVTDRTLKIEVRGKPNVISISTSRFQEEKFHMNGLLLSMNSQQRISRLVTQYSGSTARYTFDNVLGDSRAMAEVVERSRIAAMSDSNVLLLGESGVGKDIIAQAIHNGSQREQGPFVAVNCASFSKELIASELFGYESGAFTGAKRGGNIGKFELANNGTLLLDEIGDMPLDLQAVLLRALEENSFMKVGGNELVHVNVRIIAATNQNLSKK